MVYEPMLKREMMADVGALKALKQHKLILLIVAVAWVCSCLMSLADKYDDP